MPPRPLLRLARIREGVKCGGCHWVVPTHVDAGVCYYIGGFVQGYVRWRNCSVFGIILILMKCVGSIIVYIILVGNCMKMDSFGNQIKIRLVYRDFAQLR